VWAFKNVLRTVRKMSRTGISGNNQEYPRMSRTVRTMGPGPGLGTILTIIPLLFQLFHPKTTVIPALKPHVNPIGW